MPCDGCQNPTVCAPTVKAWSSRFRVTRAPDPIVKLKTYIVEDNATIRENLIGTLEELAFVESVGIAETEDDGKSWLVLNPTQWDLAIVDLFLRQGSGLACWPHAASASPTSASWCSATTPRQMSACAARNWAWMPCLTNPPISTH